jgi:hypothetical protein
MSKSLQPANIKILAASFVWGLTLWVIVWEVGRFFPEGDLFHWLWVGGNYLALMFYPVAASLALYRKTRLWRNAFLFSMAGSLFSSMGGFVGSAIQAESWMDVGLGVVGIFFIGRLAFSQYEKMFALQSEWQKPLWQDLNEASWLEYLLLRFYSVSDHSE